MTAIYSSHTRPIEKLKLCLHNEYLKCVLTQGLSSDENVYLFYYMCSALHMKDKIYSSTALIKIFSFSQFGYWLFREKSSILNTELKCFSRSIIHRDCLLIISL